MAETIEQGNRFYLSRKLVLAVTLFIVAAGGLVVLTNYSINMIAASRDYTSLLAKWSQYHTQSGIYLERYGRSGSVDDFRAFEHSEREKHRLGLVIDELFKDNPDKKLIFKGLRTRQVDHGEISALIVTMDMFGDHSRVQAIEEHWRSLQEIEQQRSAIIERLQRAHRTKPVPVQQIDRGLAQLNGFGSQWNSHSQRLFDAVGRASLQVKRLGLWISVILGILLVLIGIVVSVRGNKSIQRWEHLLNEKEVLLGEVHHRVKNNLAVISGLLELEEQQSGNSRRAIHDSRDRIHSMAMIHKLLYQSNSFSKIDFGTFMHQWAAYIRENYLEDQAGIHLRVDAESMTLNINQAVPLGLLLNDLLVGAVSQMAEIGGQSDVEIQLREEGDQITLSVCDYGQGLPDESEFNTGGTAGITIIKTLVKQLNADISIQNGRGTTYRMQFEKSNASGSSNSSL